MIAYKHPKLPSKHHFMSIVQYVYTWAAAAAAVVGCQIRTEYLHTSTAQ